MLENFLIIAAFVLYTVVVFHFGSFYILWKIVSHPDRKESEEKLNELRDSLEEIRGEF